MWITIRSIASILLSYGLLLLANGMFGTLLGLRSRLEGFTTETTGFIMAGFFVGLLTGGIYAVRIIAAVGHIRAFAAFASMMSVAVLAHLLKIDPVFWFILRVAAGFCMAGMVMIVESWINERATNEMRGQVLSVYMITNYLGAGTGQLLLMVGDPEDFQLFVIASIILSIALVPVLLTRSNAPTPSSPVLMKFKSLFMISPLGIIGVFCAGLANSSTATMGPIFAKDVGLSIQDVSLFMASVILGGMVLQFPLGKLSDRLDRRTILLLTTILTVASCASIIWIEYHMLSLLFVAALVYGGLSYTVYPMASSQVNDLADPSQRVQIASGLLITYGVGAIFGPILSSQLMGRIGPEGLFIFNGSVLSCLILFTLYRMFIRKRGDKNKATFLPLGGIGMASKQLYNSALNSFRKGDRRRDINEYGGDDKRLEDRRQKVRKP